MLIVVVCSLRWTYLCVSSVRYRDRILSLIVCAARTARIFMNAGLSVRTLTPDRRDLHKYSPSGVSAFTSRQPNTNQGTC